MKVKKSRSYSLVTFDTTHVPTKAHKFYPFRKERVYVFFGEIVNMKDHCIVMNMKTGKLYSGCHTENFREVSEKEI